MTTTADPATRPVVSLPALKVSDRELQAEDQWVADRIPADADAAVRAKAAARLNQQTKNTLAAVRADRDRAAYTVHVQCRVRRGGGIADALGVGRTRWQAIKEAQAAKDLPLIEDAVDRLPALAHRTALLDRREQATMRARNAAVNELIAAGWSQARAAAWIGRDAARVSHIRQMASEAAAS